MKYKTLEQRLAVIENKIKTFEAKQVGDLYHVCTLDAYVKYILPKDTLQASGKYFNYIYGGSDYVSFTRDPLFMVGTKSVQSAHILVQLVIDGNKLSEKYKIGPYNDFAFDNDGSSTDSEYDNPKYREKEEVVKGPITNLSKYIKEIRFDVFDMDSNVLKKLTKSKLASKDPKYFKFIREFQDASLNEFLRESHVKNGTPLKEMLDIFKTFIDRDKFDELLFSYDEDDVRKAIKLGANVNAEYPSGYPLSSYCDSEDSLEILTMLLDANGDPNGFVEDGATVMCIAAEYDNTEAMQLLFDYGANVNKKSKDGSTPLMHAVKERATNAIKWLLKNDADVNAKSKSGDTALSLAKTKALKTQLTKAGATE